jgi:hypothetical protein
VIRQCFTLLGSMEVKMYSDFKSPYAFLAFDPGMSLGQRFDVRVRWIPFQLRVKGKGERSVRSRSAGSCGSAHCRTGPVRSTLFRVSGRGKAVRPTSAVRKRQPRTTCSACSSMMVEATRARYA